MGIVKNNIVELREDSLLAFLQENKVEKIDERRDSGTAWNLSSIQSLIVETPIRKMNELGLLGGMQLVVILMDTCQKLPEVMVEAKLIFEVENRDSYSISLKLVDTEIELL